MTGRCNRSFTFDATSRRCPDASPGRAAYGRGIGPCIIDRTARERGGILQHHLLHAAPLGMMPWSTSASSRARPASSASRHSMPSAHVFQPPGRVDARPIAKADVARRERGRLAAGHLDQCVQAMATLARTQAAQACRDQRAVVGVQRHQSATVPTATRSSSEARSVRRHQAGRPRACACAGRQHVEDHAHARQHLAGKASPRVGIDDGVGQRQRRPAGGGRSPAPASRALAWRRPRGRPRHGRR